MHTYCTFVNTCIIDLYLPNEVMGVVVQQAQPFGASGGSVLRLNICAKFEFLAL